MDALRLPSRAQANLSGGLDPSTEPSTMIARISNLVHTSPWCRVLSVGSRVDGPAEKLAALTGCEVVAMDLLLPVLSASRRHVLHGGRHVGERLSLVAARPSSLPYGPARFDQVWCLGLVAHVADPLAFGEEVVRVLRPGGVTVLTEALWDGIRAPRFARAAPNQWQALTTTTLAALLAQAGLEDVEATRLPGEVVPGGPDLRDPLLREDLADRRLVPHLVTARRPR